MDPASEALMRSSLHDLANLLSGIRGILDLSDPGRPLTPRDRTRLDALLTDGMTTIERARHLALGTLPEALLETGPEWRRRLEEALEPLAIVFRCRVDISFQGESLHDRWPGELVRGYVVALCRQVLPYVREPGLEIRCEADHREWRLHWNGVSVVPESLHPDAGMRPKDISARWALQVAGSVGASLAVEDGAFLVRIPRF